MHVRSVRNSQTWNLRIEGVYVSFGQIFRLDLYRRLIDRHVGIAQHVPGDLNFFYAVSATESIVNCHVVAGEKNGIYVPADLRSVFRVESDPADPLNCHCRPSFQPVQRRDRVQKRT